MEQARAIQAARNPGKIPLNARLSHRALRDHCELDADSLELLRMAMEQLHLSARAYDRILKVARTIADLAGSDRIESPHLMEAIQYRSLDRSLLTSGDAGYNANNGYRNSNAFYVLPSEGEWYKAAYYSGSGSTYYDYATGSDTIPTATAGSMLIGEAVYAQSSSTGPADIDNAGGPSPYGTVGQNGNSREWLESAYDGTNDAASLFRGIRGGGWYDSEEFLRSSFRSGSSPSFEDIAVGFRVASVPEPSTVVLIAMALMGWVLSRRTRRSL